MSMWSGWRDADIGGPCESEVLRQFGRQVWNVKHELGRSLAVLKHVASPLVV
jgi:hypothetical protein